ncbi:MAG: hypothetical protein V4717_13550 [Bacteroidota bacterium]
MPVTIIRLRRIKGKMSVKNSITTGPIKLLTFNTIWGKFSLLIRKEQV